MVSAISKRAVRKVRQSFRKISLQSDRFSSSNFCQIVKSFAHVSGPTANTLGIFEIVYNVGLLLSIYNVSVMKQRVSKKMLYQRIKDVSETCLY